MSLLRFEENCPVVTVVVVSVTVFVSLRSRIPKLPCMNFFLNSNSIVAYQCVVLNLSRISARSTITEAGSWGVA